jgi:hypothetical protein
MHGDDWTSRITAGGDATFAGPLIVYDALAVSATDSSFTIRNPGNTADVVVVDGNGAASFASGNFDLADYGALSIKRTDGHNYPLIRWGTDGNYSGGGIYPDGDATFAGVISADAGIDFSGISSTANSGTVDNNLLDDYEEGTFTPILTKYTPGTMSGVSYSTQAGLYTKIGDIVHVQIRLAVNAGITWGTSSGAIKIADLPFAFGRVNMPVYKGSFHYTNSSTMYYPSDFMWLSSGSTITGVDSAWNSFTTEFDGACGIYLVFSYTTTA